MKAARWGIAIIAILLLLAVVATIITVRAAQQPADWLVAQTVGIDKYEAHVPFFAEKKIRQRFIPTSPTLSRLDVLIVDLKKKGRDTPITLTLHEEGSHHPLREVTVPGTTVADDTYLPFRLEPPLEASGRRFEFTLAAPGATRDAPYAIRHTPERTIAFGYYRATTRSFLWRQWLKQHRRPVTIAVTTLTLSLTWLWLLPRGKTALIAAATLTLLAGTLWQANVLRYLNGDPGGDAYYYYVTAHQIAHGIDPLAYESFRLPFYPLLLLPGLATAIPDFLWARILGIAATIGTGFGLLLLARALHFRPVVGIAAWAWLYANSHYVVTSLRPRPYNFFAFLLMMSTTLLFYIRTPLQALLWGILLGIMGMTRQEAFIPIALLGIAFFVSQIARHKALTQEFKSLPWKTIIGHTAAVALPLLLLISPYFYQNYRQYNNPFDSPYFYRTDVQNPKSLSEFWHENLVSARGVVASAWLPSDREQLSNKATSIFQITLALLAAVIVSRQLSFWQRLRREARLPQYAALIDLISFAALIGVITVLLRWLFWQRPIPIDYFGALVAAAMIVGAFEIIRVGRWRGVLMVTILLSQLGIAAYFQPAPKHFQQAYPFIALCVAAALLPLTGLSTTLRSSAPTIAPGRQALHAAPLIVLLAILAAGSLQKIGIAIDIINYPAAPYYVGAEAAEQLERLFAERSLPVGTVAAEVNYQEGDGIYSLHSYQQNTFKLFEEDSTPAAQWQWLCDHHAMYVVDNDDLSRLSLLNTAEYQDRFRLLFDKTTIGKDNHRYRVSVHQVDTPQNCPSS